MSESSMPVPVGVVLLTMGGADSAEAIAPFLENLFSDPLVIPVWGPVWFRRFMGRRIAKRRAPQVRPYYERIGFSPLNRTTEKQAQALEARLGADFRCFAAFRYWGSDERAAVEAALNAGARSLVALPMYPQYCKATTLSSLRALRSAAQGHPLKVLEVERFFDDEGYLQALREQVLQMLSRGAAGSHVIFSAHGVPESLVSKGDPYVAEVEATARSLAARLPKGTHWHLAYQSRVGPVKWVKPWTDELLLQLAADGVQAVLMVPITFVADHIETVDEMDIRLKEIAERAGIREFRRVSALNDDPAFIEALAGIVLRRVAEAAA